MHRIGDAHISMMLESFIYHMDCGLHPWITYWILMDVYDIGGMIEDEMT